MAYVSGGSLSGLYGISPGYGSYGDANVVALLSNYQYPIYVNNSITATGNVTGNIIVGNAFYYGNGVNVITSLYSNANAQSYLPTYSGLLGGTLIANNQPNITAVGTLVNLSVSSNVDMAGYVINNVGIPVEGTDAVNKQYVDTFAQGLNVKAAVSLTTAGALPGYVYYNGVYNDGIGATITGLSNGLLTIDSTTVPVGARVLIKNETSTNAPYNGIYICNRNDVGSTFQLERTTDFDTPDSIYGGFTYTVSGSTNIGTSWVNTNTCVSPITIGVTPITFTQFSQAGTLVGGNAISINTGVINALVDNSTITINGNNQISATGYLPNGNIGNIVTNSIVATGNVTSGNVFTGNITANVITANAISAPAIINLTNLSVSGNVTATTYFGSGANLTGLYGNSNVIAFLPTYAGSLNSVNNIIATGSISGNVVTANTLAVNNFVGNSITLTNILTANIVHANLDITTSGNISANSYIHSNADIYSATNITSGNLIYAAGNIDANLNISANGYVFSGNGMFTNGRISATGNIQGANVITGNIFNTSNISAGGNVYAGNILLTANASATGNITGSYIFGNGYYLTGITGGGSGNGVPGGPANSVQLSSGTGNFVGSSNLIFSGNVLSVVGNVAASYFVGTATTAQYADLAEMYAADELLNPGTVVEIGGSAEIRATTRVHSTSIIGIVSTQPAYLMNSKLQAYYPLAVALTGRVPCRVVGKITKGDLLVSSNIPGVATSAEQVVTGSVIGKALEDYDSTTEGVIEVVVGRV